MNSGGLLYLSNLYFEQGLVCGGLSVPTNGFGSLSRLLNELLSVPDGRIFSGRWSQHVYSCSQAMSALSSSSARSRGLPLKTLLSTRIAVSSMSLFLDQSLQFL
jgi:hypothetical protein